MRFSITKLEDARRDVNSVVYSLLNNDQGGAGKTFKRTFEAFIGKYHKEEIETGKLITQLTDAYKIGFVDNIDNKKRAHKFTEAFVSYIDYMNEHEFGLDNHHTKLNWAFDKDLILYGYSPILCSSDTRNIAFAVTEDGKGWINELKFPLFQFYLAQNYFKCDISEVEVGVFDIANKVFAFNVYCEDEIKDAIQQTGIILSDVKTLYDKLAA
jgi:hypothetical protein